MIEAALPDQSRVWIFALSEKLSKQAAAGLLRSLTEFCASWKAHGAALEAAVELVEDQIIVVAASDNAAQASGCSIDQMTRVVNEQCGRIGAKIVDPGAVLFKTANAFEVASRPLFKQLFAKGELTLESCVVDTTISTLKDFRAGKLFPRLSESWHAKLVG